MSHSVDGTPGARGQCMRCGFDYKLRSLRKEWTGAIVCPECWDPKPEDLRPPRVKPEGLPKRNATGQPADNYIDIDEHTREDL